MTASIPCELREVVLRNKPDQMLAISSKATVPVLQLPGHEVIDESIEVMRWALEQSDPERWLDTDRAETSRLIDRNDGSFKQDLDHYKYFVNYPEHSQAVYRQRGESFLADLEQRLELTGGIGLMGDRTTLADIAIFPFVRQFSRVDWGWFADAPYERLRAWLLGHEASDLYQSVMKKYAIWVHGDPVTLFAKAA